MTKLKEKIIETFSNNQNSISTSFIANEIFKQEINEINYLLQSPQKEIVKIAKRKKAKLHRKLLYHLNELIKEDIIIHQGNKGKGEK